MQYLLKLSDANGQHMALLSLSQETARQPAIDLVFDTLSVEPSQLVANGILEEGQLDDFQSLQSKIFDSDDQGIFIRDDVSFTAAGKPLDPDAPMDKAFLPMRRDGVEYRLCDLIVAAGGQIVAAGSSVQGTVEELSQLFFLHQLAIGGHVDVIKEVPELQDIVSWAEKQGLIEIDVQKTSYKLTEKGKRAHESYVEEGQNLIKRYDLFADVDIDSSGSIFFETGLGRDLRIAVYEMEGVDPYRARFILGLNDGEWDKLDDWESLITSESWYREIFKVVDSAFSANDVGRDVMERVLDRGKAMMRSESQTY